MIRIITLGQIQQLPEEDFLQLMNKLIGSLGFTSVQLLPKEKSNAVEGTGAISLGIVVQHFAFLINRAERLVEKEEVQHFRASFGPHIDKGLIISTSNFSREAKKEKRPKNKIPIDFINGEELIKRLNKLQ